MTEAFINKDFISSSNHGSVDVVEVASVAVNAAVAMGRAGRRWRMWAKAGIIAFSALGGGTAATVTAVSAVVGYKAVKPQRRIPASALKSPVLPPEQITFTSADGLTLNGYFYPNLAAREAIIMCHGFHGAGHDLHEAALDVQAAGYNALTFDFRGCGASGGKHTSVGFWEVQDVLGAVEYLKSRPEVDPERIGAYGISMGGATVIIAAQRCPDIKVLVTDCAFASLDTIISTNFRYFYRLPTFPFSRTAVWWSRRFAKIVNQNVDAVAALNQLGAEGRVIPHLIIHGGKDRAIPVSEAHLLYAASPGPKELWINPEADHVVGAYHNRADYVSHIDGFLRTHFKRA